jgi:uncharacterized protein RhaS with RHS repeats
MSYSPNLGRWLEQDPVGYDDGMNTYQYVSTNPIKLVDPTGTVGSTGGNFPGWNAPKPEAKPKPPAPNSTATGADIFNDFMSGTGPDHRYFKPGDHLMNYMVNHGYIAKQRGSALAAAKAYCCGSAGGPMPKSGKFQSRPPGGSQDYSTFEWTSRDIASQIKGGDDGYIGTFSGGWEITSIDCDGKCATVSWRTDNTMNLGSALYGQQWLTPYGPAPKKQTWMWQEKICW